MISYTIKLVGALLAIFIIVGNLTAPAEITQDSVQLGGATSVFHYIGKFIATPFENLKYRTTHPRITENYFDNTIPRASLGGVDANSGFYGKKSLPYEYRIINGLKVYYIPVEGERVEFEYEPVLVEDGIPTSIFYIAYHSPPSS